MSFVFHEEGGANRPRPSFDRQPNWLSFLRAVIRFWALIGGLILAALVLMTAASAVSNLVFDKPLRGDYEMAKHFIAIAIFCFLPYCQLTGANVTVDIFTEGMSERAKSAMLAFASLFAIVFSLVLLRQMSLGLIGYIEYPETTATLHIPLWTAFPPALVSLFLLLVASLITMGEGLRGTRRTPPPAPTVSSAG